MEKSLECEFRDAVQTEKEEQAVEVVLRNTVPNEPRFTECYESHTNEPPHVHPRSSL